MKPIILHIPHSSTNFPSKEGFILDSEKINQEVIKLTDWYTDELFYSDSDETIISPFSRMFCDVERFENDDDEIMSKVGMGVLYEKFDDGELLREVSKELRETIIENYYRIHHNHLTNAVESKLANYNKCIIIDCHSFPSIPLIRDLEQNQNRPDFNIGIDEYHTPIELIELSKNYFESLGYTLGINTPYSGTIVPMDYYNKNRNVNSIMLEINRKLYLDEPSNNKNPDFNKIKQITLDFITLIRNTL